MRGNRRPLLISALVSTILLLLFMTTSAEDASKKRGNETAGHQALSDLQSNIQTMIKLLKNETIEPDDSKDDSKAIEEEVNKTIKELELTNQSLMKYGKSLSADVVDKAKKDSDSVIDFMTRTPRRTRRSFWRKLRRIIRIIRVIVVFLDNALSKVRPRRIGK